MTIHRHLHIIIYIATLLMPPALLSCGASNEEAATTEPITADSEHTLPDSHAILSSIKENADLVTTEVTIRKICIYDSSKQDRFVWTDPTTWKLGEKMCIVPIDITIKYGYDLREMTTDNIKLTDDSTAVVIQLPPAKIVDSGYSMHVDERETVAISTGLRSKIGHELREEIRRKGYEAVMKEDLSSLVGNDVELNAKVVFESIVKNLGYEDVSVVVVSKKREK